ncbi:hypothetical protein SARC_06021 [Sphaeroforma arctica JP610]|uniref:Uncharacterized protein n=1 Tax=Sphaeroforma arctica JP610 TaxID=667725 RepID=A0A0L0FXX2_9EUKA|nr:hypothetical protein SARC_06021 [Sphaeroforma arctica JP610]KNC81667.1 hypothetical protein SARC_06021 [Sphaeroforma arctica JP610]|eukprot:XP_014155569.1 hypothetical protein SARC_06021 [Sphaeroforma arctica JP610]
MLSKKVSCSGGATIGASPSTAQYRGNQVVPDHIDTAMTALALADKIIYRPGQRSLALATHPLEFTHLRYLNDTSHKNRARSGILILRPHVLFRQRGASTVSGHRRDGQSPNTLKRSG